MIIHHATSVHNFETVSGIVTELSGSFWLRLEVDGKEVLSVFGTPGQEKYLRDIADAINTARSPAEEAETHGTYAIEMRREHGHGGVR